MNEDTLEKGTSGTEIILKPEKAIFGDTAFSKKVICDWLEEKPADIMKLEINVHGVDK